MKYLYEYNSLSQLQYWFGDSKVVDEYNKPLVVYHGTSSIITEFDDRWCGDNTCNNEYGAFYFTNNKTVAEDYSRQSFLRRFEDLNYTEKNDAVINIMELGYSEKEAEKMFDDIPVAAEEQIKFVSVYLKIENPYIIDGHGELANIEKTQKIINVLKNGAFEEDVWYDIYDTISHNEEDIEDNREDIEETARNNYNLEDDDEIEEYMFDEALIEVLGDPEINYDGIIYKNCIDDISDKSSIINDVYIIFNANQIKSINSKNFSTYTNNIHENKIIINYELFENNKKLEFVDEYIIASFKEINYPGISKNQIKIFKDFLNKNIGLCTGIEKNWQQIITVKFYYHPLELGNYFTEKHEARIRIDSIKYHDKNIDIIKQKLLVDNFNI